MTGILLAGLHGVLSPRAPAAELRLRSQCQCRAAVVTLGDLAEIVTGDARQADALAAVELFPAPTTAEPRYLRLQEIQDLLVLRGISPIEHRLSGAARIAVHGGQSSRTGNERPLPRSVATRADRLVRDALTKYLRDRVSPDYSWDVEVALDDEQVRSLAGVVQEVAVTGGNAPWTGSQRFEATVYSPDGTRQFVFNARVSVRPAVVATVTALPRGAVLRASDVELRNLVPGDGDVPGFRSIEEVIGMETTSTIAKGKVLPAGSVRAPLLVRRSDIVTVCARSSGILVRTQARAREDGSLGDLVNVESLSDRTAYVARVSAMREVEVYARSIRAASTSQGRASTNQKRLLRQ
ncbi:MAG: flagellar basal body P-ring formation protein FlgA [Candidatus Nealsonbacteria bacterium]|nr:flagellar basal body P-ring formation protein FlgA [Candidatus Nealsonbacteria bacterium]